MLSARGLFYMFKKSIDYRYLRMYTIDTLLLSPLSHEHLWIHSKSN